MLSLAAFALALPQLFGRQVIDPADYASASGAWSLHVDPSDIYGKGGARYRMTHDGAEAWSAELDVTLLDARVTTDGHVAGFALSKGWSGLGDLRVVALAPDGRRLLDEAHRRTSSRFPDGPNTPIPADVLMLPSVDAFVVRVLDPDVNVHLESWWAYRLSTGAPIGKYRVADELGHAGEPRWITSGARALDDPGLVLAWGFVARNLGFGSLGDQWFALLTPEGEPVWTLVDPGAFGASLGGLSGFDLLDPVRERGGSAAGAGGFRLWRVALAVSVDYSVERDPATEHGWRVAEVARTTDLGEPTTADAAPPDPPRGIELGCIATVPLERATGEQAQELGPVAAWAFSDSGGFDVVRSVERGSFEHLRVDAAGAIVAITPFRASEELEGSVSWTHLGGERWLVTSRPAGVGMPASAWFASAGTGLLRPVEGFVCPSVEAVAAAPDGGFVLLALHRFEYTFSSALVAFDAEGRERWRIDERSGSRGDPYDLSSPEDVVVLGDGTVVVLDVIKKDLLFFDSAGAFVRTVDLEAAWDTAPRYPTGLSLAPDDGLLVLDTGKSPLRVVSLDGTIRSSPVPVRADGHGERALAVSARFAPDGALWTCDGHRLYRLDPTGREIAAIGAAPAAERFHDAGASRIDRLGRICMQDRRNAVLHVWDASGRKLLTAAPEPTDFERADTLARIVAGPDGGFVVEMNRDHLRFDAQGRRIGLLGERGSIDYLPGSERSWSWGARIGVEVRSGDEVVATVTRLPSDRWVTSPSDVFPFDDGSFALLVGDEVGLYGPGGEPRESFALPSARSFEGVSATERWLLVSGYGADAWLIDRRTGEVAVFRAEVDERATVEMALSPDGAEVWVLDEQRLELIRYALP